MKFIRDIVIEDIEEIIQRYNLSINIDTLNSYTIAKSVYFSCQNKMIIPQNLIELFTHQGVLHKFRRGIINHLVFNTHMHQYIQESGKIESNHGECNKMVKALEKNNKYKNFRNISNYIKILENKIGGNFSLNRNFKENSSFNAKKKLIEQFEIPNAVSPFIFLNVINYDFYQDAKDGNFFSTNVLQNIVDMFEDLLKDKVESEKEINHYLFEREYNIQLNLEIQKIMGNEVYKEKFEDTQEIYKVLSLLTLLPNIKGRLDYVEPFLKLKKKLLDNTNEFGEPISNFRQFIWDKENKEFNWCSEISKTIIHLALFSIPVMELLHFNLAKRFEINVSSFERNIFFMNKGKEIDVEPYITLCKYNQIAQNKFFEEKMEKIAINNKETQENPKWDKYDSIIYSVKNTKDAIKREVNQCTDKIMNLF